MPKKRLTELTVVNTKAPPRGGRRLELWDVQLPGFGLRITPQPHDHRTYFCMCMVGAGEIVRDGDGDIVAGRRLRRFTIGNARVVPLDQARQRAREILRRAEAGEDPTQQQATVPIFRDFAADYLRRRKGSLRAATFTELARIFREIGVLWGNRTLSGIRREDAVAWLDDKAAVAPFAANRGLSAMRILFGDAERRGLIESSPVARLKPPAKEHSRERSLGDDEIAILWEATGRLGHPFGGFYRLLLLTGQRRGQAAGMTWDEVDPEHALWTTPGSRMKTGKQHAVHLSGLALEVLAEVLALGNGSGFVFSTDGVHPLRNFARAKARLDRSMAEISGKPLPAWHVHDLRRTMTHGLAAMGIPPHVADRILAHTSGAISGTAAIYNKFAYIDERRDALMAWGRKVQLIIGRRPHNVFSMASKK
jgi:integrase